ncbi:MAG: NUMOD1 domain-containing DNA-binding protein [Cetobacterium sp.]
MKKKEFIKKYNLNGLALRKIIKFFKNERNIELEKNKFLLKDELIEDIVKFLKDSEIKKNFIKIKGTKNDYVDEEGNFYFKKTKCEIFKKRKLYKNKKNGYLYVGLTINNIRKTYRAHKIIALCFLKKENESDIVMHINNIKTDNRIENLKYGSVSENTKQAINDKLLIQKKGKENKFSKKINMYDKKTNILLKTFHSIGEASRELNICKSLISRHCIKNLKNPRKYSFYFNFKNCND